MRPARNAALHMHNSEMPGVDYWESLLDVPAILNQPRVDRSLHDVVELADQPINYAAPPGHLCRFV